MKTSFLLFCILVGVELAQGTTQSTLNQYKPPYLYIATYHATANCFGYSSGTSEFNANFNYNFTCLDNMFSGNSYSFVRRNTGSTGYASLEESVESNIEICVYNWTGGNTSTITNTGVGDVLEYQENGSYSGSTPVYQSIWFPVETLGTVTYNVTTIMKLHTGGGASSKLRNLFEFSGSAQTANPAPIPAISYNGPIGNIDPFYEYNLDASGSGGQSLPPQNITIGSCGQLDQNGKLYYSFPDNADVVVTPTAGAGFYLFWIGEQKYRALIQANNAILSQYSVVTNANFCVGQQINYSLVWSPSTPAGINPNNSTYLWDLPGSFVNECVTNPSYASDTYTNNSELLNFMTTSCWYINSPGGAANLAANLSFSDGQQAVITAKGQFAVFRPTISGFQAHPPYFAALVPSNSPSELQLGNNVPAGLMWYGIRVNCAAPFSGSACMVQLINASRAVANTTYGGGQESTTDGEFYLDNQDPYPNTDCSISQSTGYFNGISLYDQPGYGLNYIVGLYPINLCSINDSFKDYIMFQPNGNNSIWVTLGRVFWSWSASTTQTNGVWSNPTYQVSSPSKPDSSDELPNWPFTYYNSVNN